jgi:hypothetical protein
MELNLYTLLILSALTSFRVSEMLVLDSGPFGVLEILRGWSTRTNPILANVGMALNCVYCTGLWVSIAIGIIYYILFSPDVFLFVLFSASVAALQSILAKAFGRAG